MQLVQKVNYAQAEEEVNALLDKKVILPRRKQKLKPAIEVVAEAIQFGLVTIAEDGSVEQKFTQPPSDKFTCFTFSGRAIDPVTMNGLIKQSEATTGSQINKIYIQAYTGSLGAQIDQLCSQDRDIAECISLFFQL